jgi:transcriptional regulator with XRE-family HTH domain
MAGMEADERRNGEKTAELEGPGPVALAFGAKIRSARKTAGLSLRAFAQQLDAAHGHLSNIEQGKAKPSWNLVRRIDALLGIAGDLLSAYPELLSEWDARKGKRAVRSPVGDRALSSRIGTNRQRAKTALL